MTTTAHSQDMRTYGASGGTGRLMPRLSAVLLLGVLTVLSACTTRGPGAPVQDRGVPPTPVPASARAVPMTVPVAPVVPPPGPSAAASPSVSPPAGPSVGTPANTPATLPVGPGGRPLYHLVKRGDTLLAIALEYGQNYRDLVRWNTLDNPNLIQVDQVLRIAPPEIAAQVALSADTVAQSAPITGAQVEQRPLTGTTPATGTAAPAAMSPARAILKGGPAGEKRPWSERAWSDLARPDVSAAASTATGTAPAAVPPPSPAVADASGIVWAWPAPGRPAEEFHEVRNKGIDLVGRAGDPVLAAADGQVVYAGSGIRGYGNLVIIKHNDEYLSAYAHNRSIVVKEDQMIKRGQKIAEMGNSDADRVKLHFEIRRQGRPVDPLRFLPERR